jgi:hypothetical protein
VMCPEVQDSVAQGVNWAMYVMTTASQADKFPMHTVLLCAEFEGDVVN